MLDFGLGHFLKKQRERERERGKTLLVPSPQTMTKVQEKNLSVV